MLFNLKNNAIKRLNKLLISLEYLVRSTFLQQFFDDGEHDWLEREHILMNSDDYAVSNYQECWRYLYEIFCLLRYRSACGKVEVVQLVP